MSRAIARNAAMQMIFERLSGGQGGEDTLLMVYNELRDEGTKSVNADDPFCMRMDGMCRALLLSRKQFTLPKNMPMRIQAGLSTAYWEAFSEKKRLQNEHCDWVGYKLLYDKLCSCHDRWKSACVLPQTSSC